MNRLSVAALLCLTAFFGCRDKAAPDTDGLSLMVSIEPQKAILEQLVDSGTPIAVMLGRGANPETFDPATGERIAAENADIYFATGVLPFEKVLQQSAPSTTFVDTSVGVDLLFDTHGNCNHHHNGEGHDADPHYWSSISGARATAVNMARALAEADEENAKVYARRMVAYMAHLDSLENRLTTTLKDAPGATFAVWHPSLSYFARDFGLRQIALGQEGKEMSAKSLRQAIDNAKDAGVRVFFFQKEYDSRQAETINDGIGSRLVSINPLDYDWEGQLTLIADEIARP